MRGEIERKKKEENTYLKLEEEEEEVYIIKRERNVLPDCYLPLWDKYRSWKISAKKVCIRTCVCDRQTEITWKKEKKNRKTQKD